MIEIGAGGGSIAGLDETGLLKVGRAAAGAAPGPACYGQGGEEATVTDANLLLGYYDPGFFLGGSMTLDKPRGRSGAGAARRTARPAGDRDCCAGIHAVVCEAMAGAAARASDREGQGPAARYADGVAFGGAGPAHAVRVARMLGIGAGAHLAGVRRGLRRSASSAAPFAFEQSRSARCTIARQGHGLGAGQCRSSRPARGVGAQPPACGRRRRLHASRSSATAEMRLVGQLHRDHGAPAGRCARGRGACAALTEAFAETYRTLYTRVVDGRRHRGAVVPRPRQQPGAADRALAARLPATRSARRSRASAGVLRGQLPRHPVYDRYALAPGQTVAGPAIIEEREATTVIAPGDSLTVDAVAQPPHRRRRRAERTGNS